MSYKPWLSEIVTYSLRYNRGSSVEFYKPFIPTQISPQSRNPDGDLCLPASRIYLTPILLRSSGTPQSPARVVKSHLRAIYGGEECSMLLRFYKIFQHCCLLTQKVSAIRTLHPLNDSIHSLESFVARWPMTYQSFNCTVFFVSAECE